MSGPFALHPTPRCGAIVCRLPAVLGGDVLFSAESAAASRGLCAILAFRPFSVAVTGATINGLLDKATLTPHAMRGLLWLGLAVLPALAAWGVVYVLTPLSVAVLSALFLAVLWGDRELTRRYVAPEWWLMMRLPLSLCMAGLHMIIAVVRVVRT